VKVGIFDDHAVVREGVRWMLSDLGGLEVVCEAEDAHGAIDALRSGELDLAFLDLRMGGTSGFDVLEVAFREQLVTKIVVWSMHDQPSHVRRAMSLGASGYLLKSSGRERVLDALDSIRRGVFFFDPAVVMPPDPEETPLSDDDRNVLELMAAGLDPASIAGRLGRSETSIRQTLDGLCSRWSVSTGSELVALAIRAGVVQ
jgi:DNA-binding NarL/FixJ family response regulator